VLTFRKFFSPLQLTGLRAGCAAALPPDYAPTRNMSGCKGLTDLRIKIHFNPNAAEESAELKNKPRLWGSVSLTREALPQARNVSGN